MTLLLDTLLGHRSLTQTPALQTPISLRLHRSLSRTPPLQTTDSSLWFLFCNHSCGHLLYRRHHNGSNTNPSHRQLLRKKPTQLRPEGVAANTNIAAATQITFTDTPCAENTKISHGSIWHAVRTIPDAQPHPQTANWNGNLRHTFEKNATSSTICISIFSLARSGRSVSTPFYLVLIFWCIYGTILLDTSCLNKTLFLFDIFLDIIINHSCLTLFKNCLPKWNFLFIWHFCGHSYKVIILAWQLWYPKIKIFRSCPQIPI